jgi:hypothetical protein
LRFGKPQQNFAGYFLTRHRGPRCTVCKHPDRWRIELLRAGGASLDALAEKFGVGRDAIHRHWQHVSAEMKASYLAGPAQLADLAQTAAAEGASVLDYLKAIRTMLMGQLAAMTEAGDARGAAIVAGTLVTTLEKLGKITGEIATIAGTVNVTNNVAIINSPIFARLQAAQLQALAPYPEARAATVAAWRRLDDEMTDTPVKQREPVPLVIDHQSAPVPVIPAPPY